MNFRSIRTRMLLAALLPVSLAVMTLVALFWSSRLDDVGELHHQRARLLLHQVTLASEYGLFSGNVANLQGIVNSMQHEQGVLSVSLFDTKGELLVHAGMAPEGRFVDLANARRIAQQRDQGVDTLIDPITSSRVDIDDLFTEGGASPPKQPLLLGYAALTMSRESLHARERELMRLSLWIALLSLLVAGGLAARLGDAVVRPILRTLGTIERIGRGDFTPEASAAAADPLYEVQQGLNQMATRLAWGRDELENRVQEVTRELQVRKEEAEAATRAKSRFLAAASHDLRQPTHALGLFIARLGQLPLDAPTRALVGQLEASTQAMQDLLDSLLDISRLDAGAVPIHESTFPVQGLLESVHSALLPLAQSRGLRLRLRPTNLWARTDVTLLRRIVMNLTHNALRYTEQGTVLLACRSAAGGSRVRIEVWDSGIGISSEHQANIFKEFYQVGNQARQRSQGLGLGLNIVERSAQLLGLEVTLRSNLGCGSRFCIGLAQALPELPTAQPKGDGTVPTELDGLKVLVVEDDVFARDAMALLLASWNCSVQVACDAAHAYALVEKGLLPDLVVSDYRLGEGDNGIQVIERLRSMLGRTVPACLMSGDTHGSLLEAAQEANLNLLHKPIRPAKLRSLLRRLVVPVDASAPQVPVLGG